MTQKKDKLIKGHPDPKIIRSLCNRLEKTILGGPGEVCTMSQSDIKNECKSPGCHGGWWAVVLGVELPDNPTIRRYENVDPWEWGADALARELGFDNYENLEDWALNNPQYWGTSRGEDMFRDHEAFAQEADAFDARVIVDWWRAVAQRIETGTTPRPKLAAKPKVKAVKRSGAKPKKPAKKAAKK